MAPLAIVRKHDQSSPELLLTAASALYYGKMTKTLLKTEAEYIADVYKRQDQNCILIHRSQFLFSN